MCSVTRKLDGILQRTSTPPLNILLTGVHWGWLVETVSYAVSPNKREERFFLLGGFLVETPLLA